MLSKSWWKVYFPSRSIRNRRGGIWSCSRSILILSKRVYCLIPLQTPKWLTNRQNKKKLNSHRWFFKYALARAIRDKLTGSAFGPLLKPNVCVLLDVGTKPTGTSIYEVSFSFADPAKKLTGSCISALRNTRMSEELAERFLLIPVSPLQQYLYWRGWNAIPSHTRVEADG